MVQPLPHRYETSLDWQADSHGQASVVSRPPLVVGSPPEFGGRADWWSPEHLLLAAANACLMTTFLVLAGREKLQVRKYSSRAEGVLEKTPEGIVFTAITLQVSIEAPAGAVEQAERILKNAKKHCIISNSLKTPVTLESRITQDGDKAGTT